MDFITWATSQVYRTLQNRVTKWLLADCWGALAGRQPDKNAGRQLTCDKLASQQGGIVLLLSCGACLVIKCGCKFLACGSNHAVSDDSSESY